METSEMIEMVKAMTDETDENVISAFLSFAGHALYRYGDPFRTMEEVDFLAKYPDVVVDTAAYKLNKRGWDYQVTYTENGVRREYEDGDIPASILNRITPIAKVAGA
ncbi:MAG: DNA-packaging protein [Oscillospiraceae bacterium]|nr:DNA-packaging protein [Oscillospiraceae bacterium]